MSDIEIHFSVVLPHGKDTILKELPVKISSALLLQAIVSDIIQGLKLFIKGELYENFDAQVGETLCQIRAYKLLDIFKNGSTEEMIKSLSVIERMYQSISQWISSANCYASKKKAYWPAFLKEPDTVFKFIDEIKDARCSFDSFFIGLSYILSKYAIRDGNNIPMGMNYKLLKDNYIISNTQCKKVIHHLQKLLSIFSSYYIKKLVCRYYSPTIRSLLCKTKTLSDENRVVFPIYYSSEVILLDAIKKGITIVFLIRFVKNNKILIIPFRYLKKK